MTRNYSKRSKKPFGTYVAYSMLTTKYRLTSVLTMSKPFSETFAFHNERVNSLYVIIAKRVLMAEKDVDLLLEYVSNGNQLFIAAEYIDEQLLNKLEIEPQYYTVKSIFQQQADTAGPMRYTSVSIKRTDSLQPKQYRFFYFPFDAHFVHPEEKGAVVLGQNDETSPNYISLQHGNGRIFLHLNPEAFSNYFLLQQQNKAYAEEAFAYLPGSRTTVYWDDYYRIGSTPNESFSMFDVFLKNEMLKWSLLLTMALLIFYVAFASKRRQRLIPLKTVNSNDSISFVETIGRLYLQKKDNVNIAHKMTTYFLEYIRTHYYLNTSQLSAEFMSSLARKSGVAETEVKDFFKFIQQLQESYKVTDEELLEYNNRMQQFLK
ncbi:uncharacterized protein DUF4350 [Lacibacter cauensis]|uniref:Uncharacterized protein DUF4350 n=1 Tax=Lacibacter cauensis TaxID=510947 RepID=A0A562SW02_9BACT|nr:DUF4350 domain-containing protein [Lacibacter cauensis]TWI85469.1 uncharacterized protein DUF4350 [Lacibacter cauensis]